MLLQDLRTDLNQQHRASLQALEQRFHIRADAPRGMLNQPICKGRVQKTEGSKCAHCCQCASEAIEFYEWMT